MGKLALDALLHYYFVVITTSPISFIFITIAISSTTMQLMSLPAPNLLEVDVQVRVSIFFSDFQIFPNVFSEVNIF